MAAGLGFKDFTTGEVLTAADVDGYLMQGIWVFASAAARDAAVTSPQEGNFAFTKDTNGLWYYDGAVWVASGATGDIEGVTAGIGISGGGTSGTVTVTNSMATAIDAKGDLVAGTGADTFARLAVGANDTILTADSSTATGLKWAAAGGGAAQNFTLINTGGTALTGAQTITVNVSGKNQIYIYVDRASSVSASSYMWFRINTDSGNNYYYFATGNDIALYDGASAGTGIFSGRMGTAAGDIVSGYCLINGCNATGLKPFVSAGSGTGTSSRYYTSVGHWSGTTVSSVSFFSETGNFDSGTLYVYGA